MYFKNDLLPKIKTYLIKFIVIKYLYYICLEREKYSIWIVEKGKPRN